MHGNLGSLPRCLQRNEVDLELCGFSFQAISGSRLLVLGVQARRVVAEQRGRAEDLASQLEAALARGREAGECAVLRSKVSTLEARCRKLEATAELAEAEAQARWEAQVPFAVRPL